jgi:hypothetical protein
MMRRLVKLTVLAALFAAAAPALAVSQVFLVQNSGWMDPFYTDPNSRLKPLVTEMVTAVTSPGDRMVLASFNQSLPGAPSPRALLSLALDEEPVRERVVAALATLHTAKKPGRETLADTDLNEAVGTAITTALGGKPGLVWLFTNNRNSPNNDQATELRNREFYQLIHSGNAITKALAFPLKMPVQGERYRANGLMVYVFAVGAQGARELDALIAAGRVARVLTEPAARLKPLDQGSVRLVPRKVGNAPGVRFSMAADGKLHADVESDARTPSANIEWNLENTMYPYTITAATLEARSVLAGRERPITLAQQQVRNLAPGQPQPMASVMQLPAAELPGKWSLQALRTAGSAYRLPGTIELQLSDQKLALSQHFRQRMAELFPGDPLPDIFTPPARIDGSKAVLQLEVRVHYGIAPLMALIGAALALLAAAAGAGLAYSRPRRVLVSVDGEQRTLHTRAGVSQPLFDKSGHKVAQLKTTMFGHQLFDLREGAQVHIGR